MDIILILVIYSIIILLFVPLAKIERCQKWIHTQARKLTDKLSD